MEGSFTYHQWLLKCHLAEASLSACPKWSWRAAEKALWAGQHCLRAVRVTGGAWEPTWSLLLWLQNIRGGTWGDCFWLCKGSLNLGVVCVCHWALDNALYSKDCFFYTQVPLAEPMNVNVFLPLFPSYVMLTWLRQPVALSELHTALPSWLPHGALSHSASWSFHFFHVILPLFF